MSLPALTSGVERRVDRVSAATAGTCSGLLVEQSIELCTEHRTLTPRAHSLPQ